MAKNDKQEISDNCANACHDYRWISHFQNREDEYHVRGTGSQQNATSRLVQFHKKPVGFLHAEFSGQGFCE